MALVLDTSVLLAALDGADPDHPESAKLLLEAAEDLLVPVLVLSELDYWCHKRLSGVVWREFLADLRRGAYSLAELTQSDIERCAELQERYADLEVGVVDASVLALVERLEEGKLATLDSRHFATMRPRHVEALELMPS